MRLTSVRQRLALLSFAITAAAVGFIYLYVVPQLSSSLTAEKLRRLEAAVGVEANRLARAHGPDTSDARLRSQVRQMAARVDSRATLLGVPPPVTGSNGMFVIADSDLEGTAIAPSYPAAGVAVSTGSPAAAVESHGPEGLGQAAAPISDGTRVVWALVLSSPLDEVEENVGLIQRQIAIAGAIALIAALVAAWLAASLHARRLIRLEEAVEGVAEGDFSRPIEDESADEVGQLARAFAEMQARLARLDSARRDFIANASHELRTPLFSLGGFIELLEHESPDAEERAAFLAEMRAQVERLTKLATDLLDLSRLDSDALELARERVDVGVLARSVARELEPQARARSSEIVAPAGGAVVEGDPMRLTQVLRILVENSLRHNPVGTTVRIELKGNKQSVKLAVADDGPGIPSDARGRIFERFFSADPGSGSGLGLSIADELVVLMGGTLRLARSRSGTRLILEMPAAGAARRA